jgi:hypothetical protein
MKWRVLGYGGISCLAVMSCICTGGIAHGASLDKKGEITLGARLYAGARIQTERTDKTILKDAAGQYLRSLTFPVSSAGHLRQSRYFAEVEFKHDLNRLYEEGFGPLGLLHYLPFKVRNLKYDLIYRGEYEGTFDYGPSEFRTADQIRDQDLVPEFSGNSVQNPDNPFGVGYYRHELRSRLSDRHRLFQAYVDAYVGDLFIRFGRQILVWGETDSFRLLDNINPTDNGFGGFLLPLDERRVPLDMLRLNYYLGDFSGLPGPLAKLSNLGIYEAYFEVFAAIDDKVGWYPGINIKGSAWALPNLGEPSATQFDQLKKPARNIKNTRGGGQFKFNVPVPGIEEATLGFAHYYTFFDTPQVRANVSPNFPQGIDRPGQPGDNFLALTTQKAIRTQVTGATTTFAIPADWARNFGFTGEPIVRTELAYFHREPRHSQAQLDPFIFGFNSGLCPSYEDRNKRARGGFLDPKTGLCTGGTRSGDSWNFVLGLDTNQFIPWLNARNSFFFTTQFFYKHLNGAVKRQPATNLYAADGRLDLIEPNPRNRVPAIMDGEVLPVPADRQRPFNFGLDTAAANQPNLVHNPVDQYFQTLLISSSYASGQIVPSLTMIYDWSGSFAAIPQVTFLRDPLRFVISYSFLTAHRLKGGSGVSLLRDRDNILFQIEYVI